MAEIPDLDTLEMEGKLEEIDRGKVDAGNEVHIRIDSLPELTLTTTLRAISPLTQQSFEFPPSKTFRAYAPVEIPDPRLRPGMAATMDLIVARIPNAVIVPAQAVFTRQGNPLVHVLEDGSFRPVRIEIMARNPEEFAVSGLASGSMIALVDVEEEP
jgi:multidrug efflux pump subunit AcrA (membrane-fusion protein)